MKLDEQQLQKICALLVFAAKRVDTSFCEQPTQELKTLFVAECRIAQILDNLAVGQQLASDVKRP